MIIDSIHYEQRTKFTSVSTYRRNKTVQDDKDRSTANNQTKAQEKTKRRSCKIEKVGNSLARDAMQACVVMSVMLLTDNDDKEMERSDIVSGRRDCVDDYCYSEVDR